MDPLSITASVVTLIQISAQVTVLVKQFRDEVSVVDTTLSGILNDVDGFQQVLQSMKDTFAQEDIQADVLATGHVGSHWKNLARSLSDGEGTLDQLRSLLTSVSKSTSFLDATRKQLRLKSAIAQIAGFREQIQSYRAALQLSLSTIIVWNQMTLQKSTAKLPEKIMPNLNKLYDEIRNLGADLNSKIGRLESTVMHQGFHAELELISLTNLKECVESAADVVSTASTTLGPEGSEKASVKHGSDFGDVFKKDSNEPMQRWISSNTVYEFDDVEAPTLDPSENSTGDALTVYESDSDSDIENELVRALFSNGKKRKEQGDLHGAERHLRNCLSRFPSTTSYTSLTSSQSISVTGVSKAELLELLTETYCLQGAWVQAKSTMKEKLAMTERQTGKKSERFLWDSFRLCEILMNTKDYTEAQLHGRKALQGFRKKRESGHDGYEKTLVLLIQICNEEGNLEDEEAYAALLGSHRGHAESQHFTPGTESNADQGLASPTASAHPEEMRPTESSKCVPKDASPPPSRRPGMSKSTQQEGTSPQVEVQQGALNIRANTTSSSNTPTLSVLNKFGSESSDKRKIPTLEKVPTQEHQVSKISEGKRPQIAEPTSTSTIVGADDDTTWHRSSATDAQVRSARGRSARSHVNSSSAGEAALGAGDAAHIPSSAGAVPKATSAQHGLLSKAKEPEDGHTLSYTKLLVTLCQQELGKKPVFMIGRGREGYNCIVFSDESQGREIAKVTGCKTREEARHDAACKAYKTLVSLSIQSERTSSTSILPDIDSDPTLNEASSIAPGGAQVKPPAYTPNETPSNLSSPVDFLQSIPEIMVSPTLNDASFVKNIPSTSAQSFPVRRAASDSHIPWHKNSNAVPSSNLAKSSAENLRRSYQEAADLNRSIHRRAASTSARPPEWKTGGHKAFTHPSEMSNPSANSLLVSDDTHRRPIARPGVTFDSIESSVQRPDHSNTDPTTPASRSFSLFPSSLSKTFSLQDRRSKSDDPVLAKKKSLRFAMMGSSSKRKSPSITSPKPGAAGVSEASTSTNRCPVCTRSLYGLRDAEVRSHVDSCLDGPSSAGNTAYELPGSEPSFFAAELPAHSTPPASSSLGVEVAQSPRSPIQDPDVLSNLHRAFSKRDLSADKFENEDEANIEPPSVMSPLRQFESNSSRIRQVLLLGDAQCGKTWLSSAWCDGGIPKRTPVSARTFIKQMGGLKVVIRDHSSKEFLQDHFRRASYGVVHAVLLCFDISSADSFDNVKDKWNFAADLHLKNVPKLLVGCKRDIDRGGSQTVWTRDAYRLTAKISAQAYFETSAVTTEGIDVLFNKVGQIVKW